MIENFKEFKEKRAIVFLENGFEEIEAVAPIDILRRAGVKVEICGENLVVGANGVNICDLKKSEEIFGDDLNNFSENLKEFDAIILPGGSLGTENLFKNELVKKCIIEFMKYNKIIGAICAAPSVLSRMGCLYGKRAVCYPTFREMLEEKGAIIAEKSIDKFNTNGKFKKMEMEKVVRDGNIITAVGAGTSIEFGLELVKALCGEEKANEIGKKMMFY